MEIFEDLSFYCQTKRVGSTPTKILPNAVDELNTPVFEKAPFDFVRQSNVTDLLDVISSTEDPYSYKSELNIDNVNIEDSLMEGASRATASSPDSGELPENYLTRGINSNSCNVFYSNNSEYEDIIYYNNNTSDRVTPITTALINDEDEYLPTVRNCSEIYINNSNSGDEVITLNPEGEYLILQTTQFDTPDNSRSASEYSESMSPNIKLNIGTTFKNQDIDTPQIIDTITSFESDKFVFDDPHFNIFNFTLDNKDITGLDPAVLTSKLETELPKSQTPKIKRPRYKDPDEDDEDYEPPVIKKRKATSGTVNEVIAPSPRRGRPPKQKESVSEEYCDSTTGKYREMRDKNNEASRKSRLKRKTKEEELEQESNLLLERNIKLKAQVQELERTVSNFRTNLMQLLLNK